MEKDFVPYEESLALKELGFDEPCNTCYDKLEMVASYGENAFDYKNYNTSGYIVSRPTFSQAFRWFREKHNLNGILNHYPNTKLWDFSVHNLLWNGKEFIEHVRKEDRSVKYSTYEEAEDACINHCIKIIKLLKLK